ncbi:MAG TPA: SgcJ/EcaC family oxidoreductase [Burkholderiales bacterium]
MLALAGCQTMPSSNDAKAEILAASRAWAEAFNSCDVARIAALYDREAVFWGTTGQTILSTPEAVQKYFSTVCGAPVRPKVEFGEQLVRVHGDIALNSGSYTFIGPKGGQFPARFSFAYRRVDGHWLIVDFHSSLRPAPPKPAGG